MAEKNLINQEIVDYLLELSRLNISAHEKEKIEKDLNLILDYVNQLQSVDTSDIDLDQALLKSKTVSDDKKTEEGVSFNYNRDDLIDTFYQQKDDWLEIPPIF